MQTKLDEAAREFLALYDRQGYQDVVLLPKITALRKALEENKSKLN